MRYSAAPARPNARPCVARSAAGVRRASGRRRSGCPWARRSPPMARTATPPSARRTCTGAVSKPCWVAPWRSSWERPQRGSSEAFRAWMGAPLDPTAVLAEYVTPGGGAPLAAPALRPASPADYRRFGLARRRDYTPIIAPDERHPRGGLQRVEPACSPLRAGRSSPQAGWTESRQRATVGCRCSSPCPPYFPWVLHRSLSMAPAPAGPPTQIAGVPAGPHYEVQANPIMLRR